MTPATQPPELSPAQLAKECQSLNQLEQQIAQYPPQEMPVIHRFTHGPDGKVNLYTREIFMPAGTVLTSKIHRTQHQYIVMSGRVAVWTEDTGTVEIVAPFVGITEPGTRRALLIIEDCRWITAHPVNTDNLEDIERELIEPHDIPVQQKALS